MDTQSPRDAEANLPAADTDTNTNNGLAAATSPATNVPLYQLVPELLQPTLVALSLTYGFYHIAAFSGLTYTYSAASQFTWYVTLVGLLSCILYYAKNMLENERLVLALDMLYLATLILVLVLYTIYWFIPPSWKAKQAPHLNLCLLDQRKCSEHLHLVAQTAYLSCVVISLACSLI